MTPPATSGAFMLPTDPPSHCSSSRLFEFAQRMAGASGEALEAELRGLLEEVVRGASVPRVALLSVTKPSGVIVEIEDTGSGQGWLRQRLGAATEQERRTLVEALEIEQLKGRGSRTLLDITLGGKSIEALVALVGPAMNVDHQGVLITPVAEPGADTFQELPTLAGLLFCGLARLHSERKFVQVLHQANRTALLGRAILRLAHDFNNSLYSIGCVADVMLLSAPDPSPMRTSLETIKKEVGRGAASARRLNALGKQSDTRVETVDLSEVIESFAPVLRGILGTQYRLQIEIDGGPFPVRLCRGVLEQLLLETMLGLEPRTAAPEPFVVRLGADCEADAQVRRFRLTIGQGSTDSSWQVVASRELHELIECLGKSGVSAVCSTSCFALDFHGAEPQPVEPRTVREPRPPSTLLVVDDDDILRRALSENLRRKGFQVLEADGYASALDVSSKSLIDLLLTDVALADGDGVTLHAKICETRPNCRALFVSGYGPAILKTRGATGGEHGYLQKPCRIGEVLGTIQQLLDLG